MWTKEQFMEMVAAEESKRDMLLCAGVVKDLDSDTISIESIIDKEHDCIAQISVLDPDSMTGSQICVTREQLVTIVEAMTALLNRE